MCRCIPFFPCTFVGSLLILLVWICPSLAEEPKTAGEPLRRDILGDPLPPGARVRMGTTRWQHPCPVTYVRFLAGGTQALTAGEDAIFRVWDVATGLQIHSFGVRNPHAEHDEATAPGSLALSEDGRILVQGTCGGLVRFWDVTTGRTVRQLKLRVRPDGDKQRFSSRFPYGEGGCCITPDLRTLIIKEGYPFFPREHPVIREIDLETGKEIRHLKMPQLGTGELQIFSHWLKDGCNLVGLDRTGKRIATVGTEAHAGEPVTVFGCWDRSTGKLIQHYKFSLAYEMMLAFSPDQTILAVAKPGDLSDYGITLHHAATGAAFRRLCPLRNRALALKFSPDGKYLAALFSDSILHLWNTSSGREVPLTGEHPFPFWSSALKGFNDDQLAFTPDGRVLAVAMQDHTVRLWNVPSGKQVTHVTSHGGGVIDVAITPDGTRLITRGADESIRNWDIQTGKELGRWQLPIQISTAVFSSDARHVAFTRRFAGLENSKQIVASLLDHTETLPFDFLLDPLFKFLDKLSGDYLYQCDVLTGKTLWRPRLISADALAFSGDGKSFAFRDVSTERMEVWDILRQQRVASLLESQDTNRVVGNTAWIRLSVEGRSLVTVSEWVAGLEQDGSMIYIPEGAPPPERKMAIELWDLMRRQKVFRFESPKESGVLGVALSPDARALATINAGKGVSLWELASGKERWHFPAPARSVVFSPDSGTLAAGDAYGRVWVWNARTGQELGRFRTHEGVVSTLLFTHDGNGLVSGASDGTAIVWDYQQLVRKEQAREIALSAKRVEELGADLAGDDAKRAFRAMAELSRTPDSTVRWLRDRGRPDTGVRARQIRKLIEKLSSDRFQERQRATIELGRLAATAEPILREVLAREQGLEEQRRLKGVLQQVSRRLPPGTEVFPFRAVELLERLATPQARQLLQHLSGGASDAWLTCEAQVALHRLGQDQRPSSQR
jgi:WD40 repeat protein